MPSDAQARREGCKPDPDAGQHVVDFFTDVLRHSKGKWAGKPFALLPWEYDLVMRLFGWKRPDGTRRFRRAGVWLGKKNGKSALCSGLSLYLLLGDGEAGAEVYSAAADIKQAGIVFREAANMVRQSPALSKRLRTNNTTKTITHLESGSYFQALSAGPETKEGLNISGLMFDELHAQKTRELWDTLTYGGAAREQPLLVSISTAGWDRETIGYEQYEYAKGVIDGSVTDTAFLPCIYEADAEDDWTKRATWRKANPSLGVTMTMESFEADFNEARQVPRKEASFRRYRLNQWTEQATVWLPMEVWEACGSAVDVDALAGRSCAAGIDLAKTGDMTALVLSFPDDDGYKLLPFFFLPDEGLDKRGHRDGVDYRAWANAGYLELTPGPVTDYAWVKAKMLDCAKLYDVQQWAYDPWNASQFASDLQDNEGLTMVEFRQGFVSMSEPSKEFERLLLAGKLHHGGHPVLAWHARNVCVKEDPAGNIKPDKSGGKARNKIDGIVASIMATALAGQADAGSVYEDRGVLVL